MKTKYRYFDKNKKRMIYSDDFKHLIFSQWTWSVYRFLGNAHFHALNGIVQQSIGLTDKTGKEIYEGDIVIYEKPNASYSNIEFEVKYDNSQLKFIFISQCGEEFINLWTPEKDRFDLIKVTSNIFEK